MSIRTVGKISIWLLLAAAYEAHASSAVQEGTAIGNRLPAFKSDKFDSQKLKRTAVVIFVGAHCPTTKAYTERMRKLEKDFAGKADFAFVYPNRTDTSDEKRKFHTDEKFKGTMIEDEGAKLARLWAATHTAEVLVLDKKGVL